MTMFETVKAQAAKLIGIQNTDFASILKAANDLIEENGGIPGLQAKFKAVGLEDIFQSWVSGESKRSITTEQVEQVFGSESVKREAGKLGLTEDDLSAKLATYLPKAVEKLGASSSHPETTTTNKM